MDTVSLAINADLVSEVLLGGEWIRVRPHTFYLDSYEFMEDGDEDSFVLHAGGNSGVCATGFSFVDFEISGVSYSGPLTAIQAVRTDQGLSIERENT